MSEASERPRVDMPNIPERESPGRKPLQTTATDEQRGRVAEYVEDLSYAGQTRYSEAFAAVLADSEALAARGSTLGGIVDDLISAIDGGSHPSEDAWLVIAELKRWQDAKYPDRQPAPTHDREEK